MKLAPDLVSYLVKHFIESSHYLNQILFQLQVSVRAITMTKLIDGGGVLHSKLLVVDRSGTLRDFLNISIQLLFKFLSGSIFTLEVQISVTVA